LMRRVFGPLERLTALMRRVDPLAPGARVEVDHPAAEVAELSVAFNDMLDRLERERRDSARRALDAQEDERRRMARELHDEIGQTLTGVVLQLETLERTAPDDMRAPLRSLEASARAAIEEVRELVRRLRPEALDDFGLRSALVSLGSELAERSGLRVSPRLAGELPALSKEDELVVYRVAQEGLVNVMRHARATRAELSLQAENGAVVLRVRDDGQGIDLAILDVAMPRRTGLQAARELARRRPELKLLMLSMHEVEQYFFEALKAGASGYVLKTAAGRDLVEACRAAMRGEPFLYPPAVRGIMRDYLERAADGDGLREEPLTARELEVLKLVAEAHTSEQIAELLTISPRTVERHRENLMGKLGMRDRVQLTRYAIRRGLVEP
jgi:DNA-binding NarL/FixJ family response regulator/HAMP domain-containing protein